MSNTDLTKNYNTENKKDNQHRLMVLVGSLLLIFLVFCVMFLVGSLLLILLVFCFVFLVGSLLLIFLVFCVMFLVGSVLIIFLVFCVVVFSEVRVAHLFSFLCCGF
jgi:membrane-associated HD superfamily phosphohydrolase